MTGIHENYYGTNATPTETICADLVHDIMRHLQRHGITPDERLIKRILFKRAIGDETDLIRTYGREVPYAAFMREYQTEIVKAI
jgi:hypothetical protein